MIDRVVGRDVREGMHLTSPYQAGGRRLAKLWRMSQNADVRSQHTRIGAGKKNVV
jgi:hypothetical protein